MGRCSEFNAKKTDVLWKSMMTVWKMMWNGNPPERQKYDGPKNWVIGTELPTEARESENAYWEKPDEMEIRNETPCKL
jgi:hypothetical protein